MALQERDFFCNKAYHLSNLSTRLRNFIFQEEQLHKFLFQNYKKREKEVRNLTSEYERTKLNYYKVSSEHNAALLELHCGNLTWCNPRNKAQIREKNLAVEKNIWEVKTKNSYNAFSGVFDEFRTQHVKIKNFKVFFHFFIIV